MLDQNICRRLDLEAAVCGFSGGKAAGFAELVRGRSAAAEDEILARVPAARYPALHLGIDTHKCWMGEHILQAIVENIAEEKIWITRMAEREEFGGEGRHIPVAIKADHRQGSVCLRAHPVLRMKNSLDQVIYLANRGWMRALLAQLEDALEEATIALPVSRSTQRHFLSRPERFFEEKRGPPDAAIEQELPDGVGRVQRLPRQNHKHSWMNLVGLQKIDISHNARKRAPTGAIHPLGIVNILRPVYTDADLQPMSFDKVAPALRNMCAIRLQNERHRYMPLILLTGELQSLLVEANWQRHRFARVPDDPDSFCEQGRGKDGLEDASERFATHPSPGLAIGQVAIRTVDIAERCRLNNKLLCFAGGEIRPASGHRAVPAQEGFPSLGDWLHASQSCPTSI